MKNLILLILIGALFSSGCSNDDDSSDPIPEESSEMTLNFEFKVGETDLNLSSDEYILGGKDTVIIDQFKFILSNLSLTKEDGTTWTDTEGYYLVKASAGSTSHQLIIENVPAGKYNSLEFYIGMDSAMNFKPESFPILFQSEGMYWAWNSGYKFLVMEGRFFSDTLIAPNVGFIAHIGNMFNLKIPRFNFSESLDISSVAAPIINFNVDLAEVYDNPNRVDISNPANRSLKGGSVANSIADNYGEGMIELLSVE